MLGYKKRKKLLAAIEKNRSSSCVMYVTGDRRFASTKIHAEVIELLTEHLDIIGPTKRISFILYTNGGHTSAAWRIINLLQTFCEDLEVIVISKALSAGTLIALGADRVIMTKQGVMGPIDPSLDHPLNPPKPGGKPGATVMVSVEAIRSYIETLRTELGVTDQTNTSKIINSLAEKVHPLVLGQAFRSKTQVREIAIRLLQSKMDDEDRIEKIADFICESSGSHDYSINRREAAALGFNVEKPDPELYKLLIELHKNYVDELLLRQDWDTKTYLGNQVSADYHFAKGLLESVSGGSHRFIREGQIVRRLVSRPDSSPKEIIEDDFEFNGWRRVV